MTLGTLSVTTSYFFHSFLFHQKTCFFISCSLEIYFPRIEENEEEDGVFTVKPKEGLEDGEYAFYYFGKDIKQSKVYDFCIKKK